jgi:hypothetical protein
LSFRAQATNRRADRDGELQRHRHLDDLVFGFGRGRRAYPGTFTETGAATVGPLTAAQFINGFELGFLTSFDAFFTIDSPVGQVTGTKHLVLPSTVLGLCYDLDPGVFRAICCSPTGFGLHYDAMIESGGAFYGDQRRLRHLDQPVRGQLRRHDALDVRLRRPVDNAMRRC